MKILAYSLTNKTYNSHGTAFSGKVPKVKSVKNAKEAVAVAASAAIAGIAGTAGVPEEISDKTFLEDPAIKYFVKEQLKKYLGQEMYAVVQDNFQNSPELMDSYLKYKIKMLVMDSGELAETKAEYLKEASKEIILERIKKGPEALSDIGFNSGTAEYSNLVITPETLWCAKEIGLSLKQFAKLTGCSYQTVLSKSIEYGTTIHTPGVTARYRYLSQQEEDIRAYIKAGYTLSELKYMYGTSESVMLRLLKQFGIRPDLQNLNSTEEINDEELLKLWKKGIPAREMAKKLGCYYETIAGRLCKLGLEINNELEIDYINKTLTAEILSECVEQGMSGMAIAEKFGCRAPEVYKKLREYNILTTAQKRHKNNSAITDEDIIECYKNGMNTESIANKFNSSRSYISLRIKRLNLSQKFKEQLTKDDLLIKFVKKGVPFDMIAYYLKYPSSGAVSERLAELKKYMDF